MLNLTPHEIVVGDRKFPPSGIVARVTSTATAVESYDGIEVVHTSFGEVVGLPTDCIGPVLVSAIVLSALAANGAKMPYRVLSPDTGPDSCIRDAAGKIIGVKRLCE